MYLKVVVFVIEGKKSGVCLYVASESTLIKTLSRTQLPDADKDVGSYTVARRDIVG